MFHISRDGLTQTYIDPRFHLHKCKHVAYACIIEVHKSIVKVVEALTVSKWYGIVWYGLCKMYAM